MTSRLLYMLEHVVRYAKAYHIKNYIDNILLLRTPFSTKSHIRLWETPEAICNYSFCRVLCWKQYMIIWPRSLDLPIGPNPLDMFAVSFVWLVTCCIVELQSCIDKFMGVCFAHLVTWFRILIAY
jgi:hypothetical protein